MFNDDDGTRSKKSFSVYSSAQKSRFAGPVGAGDSRNKRRLSPGNSSKKSATARQYSKKKPEKEPVPVPVKLNLPQKKYHKDNLDESHFVEQRNFLQRKHRQEAIAAKMKPEAVRASPAKG